MQTGKGVPISPANAQLFQSVRSRNARYFDNIEEYRPIFWRPCRIRLLMVTDNGLDFSEQTFGLSTLIDILATPPRPYVRVDITVAHRRSVSDQEVAVGRPGVVRSIKSFNFANTSHFTPQMYDEVWLFGFETSSPAANNQWTNAPTTAELDALTKFMNAGGGLFGTGDHGALGSALCGHVPRLRSIRRWFASTGPFNNPAAPDMNSGERNDTNRVGHDGDFDFDDQSDDIPQEIDPKLYSRWWFPFSRVSWPHPVLCGRDGIIRVLPDHPHEGQCVTPYETNRSFDFGSGSFEEYPPTTSGTQVLPEVIATSRVLPGNNVKDPTVAQTFGAISAYDGRRAGVGRVTADATWHHFININLVGRPSPPVETEPDKTLGFMASVPGQEHFEAIKEYFRNLVLWLAPEPITRCMRRGGIWICIWEDRLLEAVTSGVIVPIERLSLYELLWIGRHARDVIGRFAGQCQLYEWIFPLLDDLVPKIYLERLWPWTDRPRPKPGPDPLPWIEFEPLIDLALGGMVAAIREEFPDPDPKIKDRAEKALDKLMREGATRGLRRGIKSMQSAGEDLSALAAAMDRIPRSEGKEDGQG